MKTFSAKKVRDVLCKFGLKPQRGGNGSGHEIWANAVGKHCTPVLRHKDISEAYIYALGTQMESIGVCKRQAFMSAIRSV